MDDENSVKFADIKEGDTVLVLKAINFGWHEKLEFWVSTKVSKVTPTQFEVDDKKYRKKDGSEVGTRFSYAKKVGDYDSFAKDEPLKDQSEEYLKASKQFNRALKISEQYKLFQKISIYELIKEDEESLESVINVLSSVVDSVQKKRAG